MKATVTRTLLAATAALGALGLGATSASAAAAPETVHLTQDVTGQVFPCSNGDLTIDSGSISIVVQDVVDGNGVWHATFTLTPDHVMLSDGAGNHYSLAGASWWGGKAYDENTPLVYTETDHFVIHGAGGVYGNVQYTAHASVNGASFAFDKSSCQLPEG